MGSKIYRYAICGSHTADGKPLPPHPGQNPGLRLIYSSLKEAEQYAEHDENIFEIVYEFAGCELVHEGTNNNEDK